MKIPPLARSLPILAIVLLAFLPFARVFQGMTLGPTDQIAQMPPWNQAKPTTPWDVLPVDGVLQFGMWRDLVLTAWSAGDRPFWNPYQLAGTPLLGNSQSGALYPLHILAGVLQIPPSVAVMLLAWFHLALFGLGVRRLVLACGGKDDGANLAGLLAVTLPFLYAWAPLASVGTTVAWIPWLLAAISGAFRSLDPDKEPSPFVAVGSVAVCAGMMILAGHLQFVAYGMMAAVVWLVGEAALSRGKALSLGMAVAGLALGACIAAPQLMPVLEFSQFSHRRNVPTGEGYQAYLGSAFKPFELSNLVNPYQTGNPRVESDRVPGISSYWPPLAKQGANFAEAALCIGPIAFVLLALAPWRERRTWVLAAIGGFALLLAFGTPLNALLYFNVPGWSSTGSPGRVIILFLIVACVIAGLAFERFKEAKTSPLWFLLAIVPLGLGSLALSATLPQGAESLPFAAGFGQPLALLLSVVVVGGVLFLRGFKASFLAVSVAAVLLGVLNLPLVLMGPPLPKVEGPKNDRIAVINANWGLTTAVPATLPPNTASYSRIHDLGGYDSLLHRDTVAMLNEVNGQDSAPPANGNMMFIKPSALPERLADAGVKEMWSTDQGVISKTEIGGQRLEFPGTATIVREDLDELVIETEGGGPLLVKDRNMPGWTATLEDGKPLPIYGPRWREVEMPDGKHQVRFVYEPPGFARGLQLFAGAVVILVAFLVVSWVQSRRKA